jgi:hypothetical protein
VIKPEVKLEFKDKGLKALFERVRAANKSAMKLGVLDAPPDLALIASVHEHGAPEAHIPQRSFLRSTFRAQQARWGGLLKSLLMRWTKGELSLDAALFRFSTTAVGDVQATIMRGIQPDLKEATVKSKQRKGYGHPHTALVATKRLYNAIKAKVVSDKGGR